MSAVRLAIADDHRLFRQGLAQLLRAAEGFEVAGEAADGDELAGLCQTARLDVVIADVSMPGAALSTLIARHPELRWVVLTMHSDGGLARQLLDAGALGFVLKDNAFEELARAVREALAGRRFVSPSVELASHAIDLPPSVRELEVLKLVAKGYTTKRIAGMLGLSVKTVETYRARLMRKLGVQSGPELVFAATQRGWL